MLLLEDMDVSETESDDYDEEETDDEWKDSGMLRVRKRKSKSRHSDMENNQSNINSSEDYKDNSRDICCSCSKISSCKTTKCKCKAMGNSCGSSCGCLATKCANRASSISNESEEPLLQSGLVRRTKNNSSIEETDENRLLATQGAELLQGALADRPAEANSEQGLRKPLSDIGNTQVRVSHPLKSQNFFLD